MENAHDDAEDLELGLEDRLTDEQRKKVGKIDQLHIGAYSRAMSVLVALGLKPATEISFGEMHDPPEVVRSALEAAGVKVAICTILDEGKSRALVSIAGNDKALQQLLTISPLKTNGQGLKTNGQGREYGALMGFTSRMIDAYERKCPRLSDEKWPHGEWPPDLRIFEVILPKPLGDEEESLLRGWLRAIKHYAPSAYKQLTEGVRNADRFPYIEE